MVKATKRSVQRGHGVRGATVIVRSAIALALAAAPASAFGGGGQDANGVATGACCAPDETCLDLTSVACTQIGGIYLGDGSTCGTSTGCTVQVEMITVPLSPNQWSLTFDQFDDAAGRLDRAVVMNDYQVSCWADVENTTDIGGSAGFLILQGDIHLSVPALSLTDDHLLDGEASTPPLAASDGVPGAGPDYFDFGIVVAEASTSQTIDDRPTLELAVGAGQLAVDVQAIALVSFVAPLDFAFSFGSFEGAHEATLVYLFDRCPADVDGDAVVGFSDLLSVLQAWGACDGCAADVDADGAIGLSDLLQVLATWGDCP